MKIPTIAIAAAATLASAMALRGAGLVLNVQRGKASDNLSKIANGGFASMESAADGRAMLRFPGAADGTAGERLAAFATMGDSGFDISVVAEGAGGTPSFDDIGGDIVIQLRRGMRNGEADGAPAVFRCFCGKQEQPPPMRYGAFYGKTDSKVARQPGSRLERLVPAYFSSGSPSPLPDVSFKSMPDGWALTFSFSWAAFFDDLPFSDKGHPVSWRLLVRRTRPDGTATALGSTDSPVALSWPKMAGKADAVRKAVVGDKSFGDSYDALRNELDFWFRAYRAERHIGFIDTGAETFEQKNPASDEIFYENFFTPFCEWNKFLQDALHTDREIDNGRPPAASMPKATFDELYAQLHRIAFAREGFEALRRDYLLARFTGEERPVAAIPKPAAGTAPAAKTAPAAAPAMDIEGDGAGGMIELDDIAF